MMNKTIYQVAIVNHHDKHVVVAGEFYQDDEDARKDIDRRVRILSPGFELCKDIEGGNLISVRFPCSLNYSMAEVYKQTRCGSYHMEDYCIVRHYLNA